MMRNNIFNAIACIVLLISVPAFGGGPVPNKISLFSNGELKAGGVYVSEIKLSSEDKKTNETKEMKKILSDGELTFDVENGASRQLVSWFLTAFDWNQTTVGWGASPSELDFVFVGDLFLMNNESHQYVFSDMVIARLPNNGDWIIGGKNCKAEPAALVFNLRKIDCFGENIHENRGAILNVLYRGQGNIFSTTVRDDTPSGKSLCASGYVYGVRISSNSFRVTLQPANNHPDGRPINVLWADKGFFVDKPAGSLLLSQILAAQASGERVELFRKGAANCGQNSVQSFFDSAAISID